MITELLQEGGLSLERLESFCLVAQAGGVTKAAKGDATKQSLFSRQIKELEVFFGVELKRRKGKGIALTPAGRQLAAVARECIFALSNFKSECTGRPPEVTIGAGESIIRWLLLPNLTSIRQKFPRSMFRLLNLDTNNAISRLEEGEIDFAIVRRDALRKPLKQIRLGRFEYSLFVPRDSGGAADESRSFPKLIERWPLATLEGGGAFREGLNAIVAAKKLAFKIEVECSSFPLVASALAEGNLAAVLPGIAAEELANQGFVEAKTDLLKPLGRDFCLAWNSRIVAVRSFLPEIQRVLAEICRF